MSRYRDGRDLAQGLHRADGEILRLQEQVKDLLRRVALVETDQGYLANRDLPVVTFYPRELVELGYPCVEDLPVG